MTEQVKKNFDEFTDKSTLHFSQIQTSELKQSIEIATVNEELLKSISHVKRFTERWHADPNFREQVYSDPNKAVIHYGINVDPKEIKSLWNKNLNKENYEEASASSILNICQDFYEMHHSFKREKFVLTSLKEPRFKEWRKRQIARATSQFKQAIHDSILHIPVCFELSKGCSVGCQFCGVSAPKLSDIFFYTPTNAELWNNVLKLIKGILGSAAGTGFCYWATDPLDNPDYEKFCSDFHSVLGIFPPTTTALSLRDPARTRSLLKLSREKDCLHNRFSILSLKMLNQAHEEFSAQELAFVSLVLQNKESDTQKANAGRVRKRNIKQGEQHGNSDQGTIACVTGFLFNMVDRSVKLISPCNADERWPLGYIVYDEGTFSDVDDLKALLERMIADNMPLTVRPSDLISFRRDLQYTSLPDGFQLSTKIKTFNFCNDPYLKELGKVIHKGDKTAQEIASLFDICGVSSTYTFETLNLMFKKGVLDDESKPNSSEPKFRN